MQSRRSPLIATGWLRTRPFAAAPGVEPLSDGSPAIRLFSLSLAALFLELMVIRWVPSEVRLVAYYANLMLVSSFLGLGVGAILTARAWNLFRLFPVLLALYVAMLLAARLTILPGSTGEFRFGPGGTKALSYCTLIVLFLLNAGLFVPLGEQIGVQFQRLPSLRAYTWDLSGSLAGTAVFGLFSFLHFSPAAGVAIVIALVLFAGRGALRGWSLPLYLAAFAVVFWSGRREPTWWSPYHFITVREFRMHTQPPRESGPGVAWLAEEKTGIPPAGLRTMRDPPLYTVRVNQDFYQLHGTIDPARYTPGSARQQMIDRTFPLYDLPYRIVHHPTRVLVLGAGGGMDVEAALLRGAHRVDAVEIDPVIARLSAQFNAAAPYANPKVVLHVDDARAFLERNSAQFDLVVFGHLDSQALSSYGASLRLDGYTYTVEGFRQAFARVAPTGAMAVSFSAVGEWMAQKLAQMIAAATGAPPLVYVGAGTITFLAPKRPVANPPAAIGEWKLRRAVSQPVDLATDDWPYLYLRQRGIPIDYAIVIGALLAISATVLLVVRRAGIGPGDGHCFFLGWGFLLLQTKSIGDCSLYFGNTWLVSTLVIAGVLLMVLFANWAAVRLVRESRLWLYAPLFATLFAVLVLPRELVLAQEPIWRAAWTVLVVPLPIFFAGLIFSSTFREAPAPALAFGANLLGATLGGFSEYLGMWFGSRALGCMVLAAYTASLWCLLRQRRAVAGSPAPLAAA